MRSPRPRKLMSILLLHDVTPWPLWANVEEINRGLDLLDAFDIRQAEFVPYYSAAPLAKAAADGVYVSGYRKKDRELLIASNLTKAEVATPLCLNRPDADAALYSWSDRQPLVVAGGCASITIPAGSFAIYYIRRNASQVP